MRKNYLANLFKVLLLFISIVTNGQSSQNYQLPQIIPASPQAQNFMRYGEIPVDFSTGVPNIDIPLYTIKGKKLTLPLSISYHASGIKVNDIASEVGLGWVFNGKGLISRTTNGRRDEAKSTVRKYNNSAEILQDLETHYLDYECTSQNYKGILDFEEFVTTTFVNEQDAMSDRYFYKLPGGESGVFVYDYAVFNENENSIITLPYRPIKIKRNFNNFSNTPVGERSFEVTDESGTVFTFQPYTISDNSSEWYVTKIVSADNTESINFNYTIQNTQSSIGLTSCVHRGRLENYNTMPCPPQIYGSLNYQSTTLPDFTTPILNSIVTDQEIITFNYENRSDFSSLKRLKSIAIASKVSPDIIKKNIQFYEKYFGSTPEDKRLALDYLSITSSGNPEVEKYSFKYNESTMLPPYPQKMPIMKFNEDFWGYANGQNTTSNVPIDYIRNSSEQNSYGANRDADLINGLASACMLQEIKYPTGGKTVFEFSRFFQTIFIRTENTTGRKKDI
uniref:YD repeat-containing protein n=1 Tax=Chryseobacterium endophyticum TaxID=1854762 RepID=A0AAU6WRU1_9FLAO